MKQNLLQTCATGSGKTYLAYTLGHHAKVYYYRLKALMELCYQGHADVILDRLAHGSIKIELKGESMRKIQTSLTEEDQ